MSNDFGNSSAAKPIILAIETATRAGSVALARGEMIVASKSGNASSSHSMDLVVNIDQVLRESGIDLKMVDVFAGAAGPGSFTGLRIGLATVKSLAVALGRKCVGVPTLAAVAQASGAADRVVAMLPAGRGEVFAQMFAVRDDSVEPLDSPAHLRPAALLAKYGRFSSLHWAGEGAEAQRDFLKREAAARGIRFEQLDLRAANSDLWTLAASPPRLAEAISTLALREWRSGYLVDPDMLRANYVRPSDAEIKTNAGSSNRQ